MVDEKIVVWYSMVKSTIYNTVYSNCKHYIFLLLDMNALLQQSPYDRLHFVRLVNWILSR